MQYDIILNNSVLNFRFFVGYGLELSRIVPLIIFHLKRKFLCKTEGDVKEAWLPSDLGYVKKIPTDMLILTVTLCYSVIAPLILPFGAVYFGLGWLVFRNQVRRVVSIPFLLFVGESGDGRYNPFVSAWVNLGCSYC